MGKVVVIDPGHGGNTTIAGSGANHGIGPSGLLEKNIALKVSVKIAEILNEKMYDVSLTRNNDTNLSLKDRAKVSLVKEADVFVSIHFNDHTNPIIQGTETWVDIGASSKSKLLASSIQQKLVLATGLKNRGVKSKSLDVLDLRFHYPTTATCLVEISFISDSEEEKRLKKDTYINSIANSIVVGITDFFNNSSSINILKPIISSDPVCEE